MAGCIDLQDGSPLPTPVAAPVSLELAADFNVIATPPVYFTIFTLVLTTLRPASFLWFNFTCACITQGAFAGNVAPTVRFRLNTVLLPGGCTVNTIRAEIMPLARQGRVAVVAGAQSLAVEISKFAGPANTIGVNPVARPDLEHAALTMLEQP